MTKRREWTNAEEWFAVIFTLGMGFWAFAFLLVTLSFGMTPILDRLSIAPIAFSSAVCGSVLLVVSVFYLLIGGVST